jgi:hypothetical protein
MPFWQSEQRGSGGTTLPAGILNQTEQGQFGAEQSHWY